MADTNSVVHKIVAKVARQDTLAIHDELRLAEDLGMKSIGRIELAALLEEELDIEIGNFEIRKPKTVGDVVTLVAAKV